jgi:hypothetical protein
MGPDDTRKGRRELLKAALDAFLCHNACGPIDLVEHVLWDRAKELGVGEDVFRKIVRGAADYMDIFDDSEAKHSLNYEAAFAALSHLLAEPRPAGERPKGGKSDRKAAKVWID